MKESNSKITGSIEKLNQKECIHVSGGGDKPCVHCYLDRSHRGYIGDCPHKKPPLGSSGFPYGSIAPYDI